MMTITIDPFWAGFVAGTLIALIGFFITAAWAAGRKGG